MTNFSKGGYGRGKSSIKMCSTRRSTSAQPDFGSAMRSTTNLKKIKIKDTNKFKLFNGKVKGMPKSLLQFQVFWEIVNQQQANK